MRSPYGRHHRRGDRNEQRPRSNYLRREDKRSTSNYPHYELVGKIVRQLKACRIGLEELQPFLAELPPPPAEADSGEAHGMYAAVRLLIDGYGVEETIALLDHEYGDKGFDRCEFQAAAPPPADPDAPPPHADPDAPPEG